ncbi:uncharacterized protein LOC132171513 [Corylus avellana]|uniref:uncharacterized protein LOC132171513 n=1 Tax=Corylus avellana TaxID=13451 RepID=UPI00286A988A|nr:uncharacterized protein LOC132171513 [Corylus avellana]
MAQDLWNTVESTIEPLKQEDDEAVVTDFVALQVIQNSSGPDTVTHEIEEINSTNIARNTLAEECNMPNNINTERSSFPCISFNDNKEKLGREGQQWHPNALKEKITAQGKTALHIAVTSGHDDLVEKLVDKMWTESLEIQDNDGWTALAETAFAGNCRMAKCMLTKNKHLASIGDVDGRLPVVVAIEGGHKELACYLYSLTPPEDLKGISGATLCTKAIYTRTLAIALDLLENDRHLALAPDKENVSPLYALASTPNAFPSENQLVFWKRWIYSNFR